MADPYDIDEPAESPQAAPSLSSQLDKEHAARAYRKVMSGEKPAAQEQAALRRYEKQQEEQRRWTYYDSIPQKHCRRNATPSRSEGGGLAPQGGQGAA